MKLGDLKKLINSLNTEQLDTELIVMSEYQDGVVQDVKQAEENMYYMGDDDPAELITEKEMQKRAEEEGWDEDEYPESYILKGDFYLSF